MRTTNTFGIQFITRMNKIKDGIAPIYVRITVDSRRIEISLKRSVHPLEWNNKRGMARGSRDDVKSLNHYLEEVKSNLIQSYQEMQIQKQLITAEAIKNKFLGIDQKEHSLYKAFKYHNDTMGSTLAWGTMKNYFTTQKYLIMFLSERFKRSDIFLTELRYKFIVEFEYFLRNYKPIDHQKPLSNNGVMKHIERFRKVINLSVKLEWLDKDPFLKYKQKFEKVEREFLSKKEMDSIHEKSLSIERLQLVRDLFIFSCFTGLSYIDVSQLTSANVVVGIDNRYWLKTKRQKTSNSVNVPLLPVAIEIIEKYKGHPKVIIGMRLFPKISNQKLNSYLKEIADLCGIRKNLTFHLARHTFATTVTLTNGVPIETVSKLLGHSSITTTQIYAKVIEKKLSEDMTNLRQRLNDLNTSNIPLEVND